MSTKWLLEHRGTISTAWQVFYKNIFVAEIFDRYGRYEMYDKDGVEIAHQITGSWIEETVQQLLFAIKQHLKNHYKFIEYKIRVY